MGGLTKNADRWADTTKLVKNSRQSSLGGNLLARYGQHGNYPFRIGWTL